MGETRDGDWMGQEEAFPEGLATFCFLAGGGYKGFTQLLCKVFCILYFILQQKDRDRWEGKKPVFIPVP